nr:SGNH/GDSL hydrolase family protein [Burkholderia ubonensis]
MLAACGGGDGSPGGATPQSSAEPPTVASTPTAPKSVLIEAYGDSTTLGWVGVGNGGFVTTANEVTQLQAKLQAKFGQTVTVSNQGIGGIEASQILNGILGANSPWADMMMKSKAQIITLNFGLNDAYYAKTPKKDVQLETPESYASIMTQLVQDARAAGKQVVLFEPNPTCEPIRESAMQDYVAALRRVARDQNVPLVAEFDVIMQMQGWQSMLSDCLHPSDALYDIKANLELPAISAIVSGYL